MSRVTRLKHVKREIDADDLNLPTENQQIARVVSSKGNNLHEVEPADSSENFLVTMPNKFRQNIWIKRGSFVLVEPIPEGDKVKAEIIRILTDEHLKEFNKAGVWPKKFTKKREHSEGEGSDEDLHRNLNRKPLDDDASDSSSSSDDN
jgi:probable RNA-binding protein EIF1AD